MIYVNRGCLADEDYFDNCLLQQQGNISDGN